MTSRDAILQRVRSELAEASPVAPPPVPEVWPRENPAPDTMAARFSKELADVQGEVICCPRWRTRGGNWPNWSARPSGPLGMMDRPLVRDVAADLPPGLADWAAAEWQPQPMAELSASVVEADILLADTGSCLIACPTAQDRLLCYLPPACVVVAGIEQLAEHLPAAWPAIAPRRGRSRTARRVRDRYRSQPYRGYREDLDPGRPWAKTLGGANHRLEVVNYWIPRHRGRHPQGA